MFYLTMADGFLVVQYDAHEETGVEVTRKITGAQDYHDFFRAKAHELGVGVMDRHIMASSSVDFPDEYTDRADVIELCNQVRGAGEAEDEGEGMNATERVIAAAKVLCTHSERGQHDGFSVAPTEDLTELREALRVYGISQSAGS